jgi:hypothetical protein
MPKDAKEPIDGDEIIALMQDFIRGERDMTMGQIRACDVLLKKVRPDLASQQLQIEDSRIIVEIVKPGDRIVA